MEQLENNPLLQPENYFEGYNDNIDKLKNNPELIEFDKMCFELFEHQEVGRKFMEHIQNRYLLVPYGTPGSPTFPNESMWGEGVRYAFLILRHAVQSHKQRIAVGTK